MKAIRTFRIKLWLPLGTSLLMLVLYGVTFHINEQQDRQALLEASLKTVQYDVATLAREIEQLTQSEQESRVRSSLMARRVNPHYRGLFIYNLQTDEIVVKSISSPLTNVYYQLTAQDVEIMQTMHKQKSAQVYYDATTELINAYFSVPLPGENQFSTAHHGILVARYSLHNELNAIAIKNRNNGFIYAAVFLLVTFIILWANRQFIDLPVQHLLTTIAKFSLTRKPVHTNIIGQGELREIADALESMSEHIVTLNIERNDAERAAQQHLSVFDSLFSVIPDLFFLLDADTTIRDFRVAKVDELYVPPESFLNKRMDAVLPDNVGKLFVEHLAEALTTRQVCQFEYQLPKAGQTRFFEARLAPLPNTEQVVAVIRDVTQQKENELLILHQAHYDALTDLPNRYLALDRLNKNIKSAQKKRTKVAVMFLDVDDFKKVNDTLGHRVGDEVLIEIAHRLSSSISEADTVARLGGDEFVVLFDNIATHQQIVSKIEAINALLNKPYKSSNRELLIAASIGVCIFPDDGKDATELLRSADTAMYHAKAHGKNQFAFYEQKMNEDMTRRLRIEECMVNALNNHEYEVYYQPQFHLQTHRLVAAEALLRWNSPELGNVSPAEFIPIAEQNGLIIAIGEFVIEQVIKQCSQWLKTDFPDFRIAINLSPRQFRNESILDLVRNLLRQYQLSGRHLEFEVTEGVLLRGYDSVNGVLSGLHELGVSISMDDFGTGYSSLSYLQDYPFDMVKIDRSFINNMLTADDSHELVKAIISMAHDLKLGVLAEGVETPEQALNLHHFGCDYIQGFLMGPALTATDFSARWRDANTSIGVALNELRKAE